MTEKLPLIGAWVYGINIYQQKDIVWGILAEFVKNKQTGIKFLYNKSKFLFLSFNFGRNPEFHEVTL